MSTLNSANNNLLVPSTKGKKTCGKAQWTKMMNYCLQRDIENKRCPKGMGKETALSRQLHLGAKSVGKCYEGHSKVVLTQTSWRSSEQFPTSADGSKAQ